MGWRRDTPREPERRAVPRPRRGTQQEGRGGAPLGLTPGGGAERRGCCNPGPERIRRRLISSGLHHPGQNCSLAPGFQESLAAEAAVAPHASGWGGGGGGSGS